MTVTGHKTRAVFDRYNIVSPGDLQDVARRMTGMFSGRTGGGCGRLSSAKQLMSDTGSWCSLVSTLDCQSRGRGFESRRARQ